MKNAQEKGADTVGREELLAIAQDFGLSEGDIDKAYKGIEKSMEKDRQVDQLWLMFKLHVLTYVCIMVFLIGINYLTSPQEIWVQYPAFCWGFFVVVHGLLMRFSPKWALLLLVEQPKEVVNEFEDEVYGNGARVNFKVPDLYGSLAEVQGLVQTADGSVLIEYETRDTVFGAIKTGLKELKISVTDLSSVQFEQKLWGTKMTFWGRRMKTFSDFPGNESGGLCLHFNRNSREAAEHLFEDVSTMIERSKG